LAQESVSHSPHEFACLFITDAQVSGLKSRPTGLTLSQWETTGLANDLAHTNVTEYVWMGRSRLTNGAAPRSA